MKVLITGGAGFIGNHLCRKIIEKGYTLICLDNFMNSDVSNVRDLLNNRKFKLVNGDVRDYNLLEKIMRDINMVVHLAAQIHVDRSIIEPRLTYDINVFGTLGILELARRYDVEKVVHTSSSEVYGSMQYVPMDERHPLNAPHIYGASKIAADRLCYAYIQTYGLDVCIARPFNTFGPYQKDTGYGGAISIFMKRVLNGQPPIIYGDGKQTRDYMYVEDLIKAYKLILESNRNIREPINFGTGKEIAIIDLANKIIELCGKSAKLKPVHVSPRPGEVRRLCADYTKAKEIIGWQPTISLEEGLKKVRDWYMNYQFEEWGKLG